MNVPCRRLCQILFILSFCFDICSSRAADAGGQGVRIVREGDRLQIGNACLSRCLVVRPALATLSVTNHLTGRRFGIKGREFVLELESGVTLGAADFVVRDVKPDERAGRVLFGLDHAPTGIRVELSYELAPEAFILRKRLVLHAGATRIRSVEVEHLSFQGAVLAPMPPDSLNVRPVSPVKRPTKMPPKSIWDIGLGQPVFVADELFLGLEHPAAHNGYGTDGVVFLRHYPGRAGRIECPPAVLGVAANRPRQRAIDAFLRYVAAERARPVKRFVEFFFDTHQFDDKTRAIIDTARDALVRRGVKLDCVTLNGWAEPREGIMEPPRACPDLLRLVSDYAGKQLDCPLGLHIYTAGCRSAALRDWIAERFDMVYLQPNERSRAAYCLADPRVASLLTANLGRYMREHGVRMYYYDWGCFACEAGDHRGHMPGYGTEAIADAFLAHLRAMREIHPDVFLCDTGWFSPWWLKWYDAVFYNAGDWNSQLRGPPALATVDLLGTWRDAAMKKRLEARPYFPATGYINHGAISYYWMDWQPGGPQPRDSFVHYVAMMFLAGTQIAEYILNLPELSEANRDDLAAVHRWGIARDDWLLADTRPLGGDPLRGETYGFAHVVAGNRGIIGLRNPTVIEQDVTLVCDEKAGFWPSEEPFAVMTTYPFQHVEPRLMRFGETVRVPLAGQELRVIEVAPIRQLPRPVTLSCRQQVVESSSRRTVLALLDAAAREVTVVSPVPMQNLLLDGKPCPIRPSACEAIIRLPGPSATPAAVPVQQTSLDSGGGGLRLSFTAEVPRGLTCNLILLLTDSGASLPPATGTIVCNGRPLEVEAPHLRLTDSAGRTRGTHAAADGWRLFRATLPAGRAEVKCTVKPGAMDVRKSPGPPPGRSRVRAQAFLLAQRRLPATHRLQIDHAAIKEIPRPSLPAHWNDVQKWSVPVIPIREVAFSPVPKE
jgi:hypothetical protein